MGSRTPSSCDRYHSSRKGSDSPQVPQRPRDRVPRYRLPPTSPPRSWQLERNPERYITQRTRSRSPIRSQGESRSRTRERSSGTHSPSLTTTLSVNHSKSPTRRSLEACPPRREHRSGQSYRTSPSVGRPSIRRQTWAPGDDRREKRSRSPVASPPRRRPRRSPTPSPPPRYWDSSRRRYSPGASRRWSTSNQPSRRTSPSPTRRPVPGSITTDPAMDSRYGRQGRRNLLPYNVSINLQYYLNFVKANIFSF